MNEDEIIELFPLVTWQVTCGNNLDLPKKQRQHIPVRLGKDIRNKGTKGFIEREIFACSRCGKDFDRPSGYNYPPRP